MSEGNSQAKPAASGNGAAAARAESARAPALEASPAATPADADKNLELILNVPVTLAMEIGRVRVPIRNLLQLTQGSVVELDPEALAVGARRRVLPPPQSRGQGRRPGRPQQRPAPHQSGRFSEKPTRCSPESMRRKATLPR